MRVPLFLLVVCQLASCAGVGRQAYREPDTGDLGSIVIYKASPSFRESVWIYDAQGAHGKSLTTSDSAKRRDFKAPHAGTIVLDIDLLAKSTWEHAYMHNLECHKVYEVPFSSGDLGLLLDATDKTCTFTLFRGTGPDQWVALTDLHEWKGALHSD